jgi:hypothetical protein
MCMYGKDKKCTQNFSWETKGEENTWEAYAYMIGEYYNLYWPFEAEDRLNST